MTQEGHENTSHGQESTPVDTGAGASCACAPRTFGQRAGVVSLSIVILLFAVYIADETLGPFEFLDPLMPFARHSSKFHSRPIVERDGRRLLWARDAGEDHSEEWFDVTESKIDPERFQYGIGKDKIPSIDEPQFVDADDARLIDAGIDDDTRVIGFAHAGDARAYPLDILDRHELVNDVVGGKPVTVGW